MYEYRVYRMMHVPSREVAAAHVKAFEFLVTAEDVWPECRRRVHGARQSDGEERLHVLRLPRAETPIVEQTPLGNQAIRTLRLSYSINQIIRVFVFIN